MSLLYAIPLFLVSLTLVIGGSVFISRALGRFGSRLDISEQLLGVTIALCADSPEISASVVSMISGQKDVAVGVVFGSNLFNLASLLGVTAMIAGSIALPRVGVLLNGGIGILVTSTAVALVLGILPPVPVLALLLTILTPYVVLLGLRRGILDRLPLPKNWRRFLLIAAGDVEADAKKIQQASAEAEGEKKKREPDPQVRKKNREEKRKASIANLALRVIGALLVIILGSTGLVYSATRLAAGWLPPSLLGTLVLATLTGIPNLYTAIRLAQHHRGSAVMTEAMNSNNLNILVGLAIPALIFGSLTVHTAGGELETWSLLLMTVAVVGVLARGRGFGRRQGIILIAAYLLFVAVRIYLAME